MRICRVCGIEKKLDDFYASPKCKDGHQNICKRCSIIKSTEYRKTHYEQVLTYNREYRRNNPEFRARLAVKNKEYRNRPEVKERNKKLKHEYWKTVRDEYRGRFLLRKYGITMEDRNEMIDKQEGKCATCGNILDLGFNTHVDHCHSTGKVRGILCSSCNAAIGYIKDDPRIANNIASYLLVNS